MIRAGIDHAGISSDFDGIPDVPKGLEDASKMPALVAALLGTGTATTMFVRLWVAIRCVMREVIGR